MRSDSIIMALPINQLTDEEREKAVLLVNQIDKRREIATRIMNVKKEVEKDV